MTSRPFRIGQILPSSNTTMETEVPAMLRAREAVRLAGDVDELDLSGVDAVILSACVQMPSLPAIQVVEDRLGLNPVVPNAGALLSGRYPERAR